MRLSSAIAALLVASILLLASCDPIVNAKGDENGTAGMVDPIQSFPIVHQHSGEEFFERPATLAAARKSSSPPPLVVLLSRSIWTNVLGSESPKFALYADGTVIQNTADGYSTARLTGEEVSELVKRLNLPALAKLQGNYALTGITEMPEHSLLIYAGAKPIFITISGSMGEQEFLARLPRPVGSAWNTLQRYHSARARPWLPEKFEVMISPYANAPEPSIVWPDDWAGISDPQTVKRGDSYSLFVTSSKLEQVKAFLKTRHTRGAIEIGGSKWSANIRIPFPHERLWMAPNLESRETGQ